MADNKKVIFFDLDDTLIKCSGYYYDVEVKIAEEIYRYSDKYSIKELRDMFNEKQFANIDKHGYGPENFVISAMQIASEVIGYDYFKYHVGDKIEKIAKILFDIPVELLDGAETAVEYLYNKGYELNIITKGMEDIQRKRVEGLSIKKYFNKYEIVKHKEKSDYLRIIDEYKLNPAYCYMVGNSPKGDINEAKLAGFNTIYIPSKYTWYCEDEEILNTEPETKTISDIKELMDIL